MKKNFIKGFSLLAVSIVLAKILGALYRIPLTNILGAEGMGLYQLVFPVYALLLTFCSGGIPQAMSILVSAKRARGEDTAKVLNSALWVIGGLGAVFSLLLIVLSKPIATLQSNPDSFKGYIVIAPSIFLSAVMAVLRGYFMGYNNMAPSAVSQVMEAAIKLGLGLTLAYFLRSVSIFASVAGALIGVTASEAVTLIAMLIYGAKKNIRIFIPKEKEPVKELVAIALPLTVGGIILPLSQFADSLLIVNILKFNYGVTLSTINYGLFSGTVAPLINLPVMLAISLGLAVMPTISEGVEGRNLYGIKEKSEMCVKLAIMTGVPFALVYVLAGDAVIRILYPALSSAQSATAVLILQIEALNVITLSMSQIFSSLLQALGKAAASVKLLALSVGLKLILTVVLLPFTGILGAAVASAAAFLMYAVLTGLYLRKMIGVSKSLPKNSSLIAVSGVIMAVSIFLFRLFLSGFAVIITAFAAGAIYLFSLFAMGVFTRKELECLPFSKLWLRLDKLFRRDKNAVI